MDAKVYKDYLLASEESIKAFPNLWAKAYPRRYDDGISNNYEHPKVVGRAIMDVLLNYHYAEPGESEGMEALWGSLMIQYLCPTYFISPDLAMAMSKTQPPDVVDCLTLHVPFPAAAFMLPKNFLPYEDEWISFIGYSRNCKEQVVDCPHPKNWIKKLHCYSNGFSIFLRTYSGLHLHWSFSDEYHIFDYRAEEEFDKVQERYSHTTREDRGKTRRYASNFTEVDRRIMTAAIKLLFNTLLMMVARPKLISPAELVKKVKKRDEKIEYWTPHYLGLNYKIRHERSAPGGGTHASPRLHWVSGHYRFTAYGPNHSLRKDIPDWIEPFTKGVTE